MWPLAFSGSPAPPGESEWPEILEMVDLADLARRYPHELSGGQQQRVAVARALAPAPALMLLDEPFSNLDADLRAQMRDEVEKVLRATGTTAIFVTHDQEEAFTLADRVGVLNRGRIEQIAAPEDVYHHPATRFVAEFVGAADFLPGEVTSAGIVTEIGVFDNVDRLEPGERVQVMVRPDDITFVPQWDGAGILTRRYFRGSETLYCIRLPSGDRVHSSQPSSATFSTGMRVRPQSPPPPRRRLPRRGAIRGHLLRWRPRPGAQRRETTPRARPSGAASHMTPSRPSAPLRANGTRVRHSRLNCVRSGYAVGSTSRLRRTRPSGAASQLTLLAPGPLGQRPRACAAPSSLQPMAWG